MSIGVPSQENYQKGTLSLIFNDIRIFEFHRLLAPIIAARWIVLSKIGGDPIITNDIGYVPYANIVSGQHGIAIPLNQNQVLLIMPTMEKVVFVAEKNGWEPIIEYLVMRPDEQSELNKILTSNAQRFIIGPSENVVEKYISTSERYVYTPPDIEILGFITGDLGVAHEHTWHRLVSYISRYRPDDESDDFSVKF